MDAHTQIQKFKEYIEDNQLPELLESDRKGELFFNLDYNKIARFDLDLADIIIEEDPVELIKVAEVALESFDLEHKDNWQPLISNLPESCNLPLNEVSDQLNRFKVFEGIVMKPTDIHLKLSRASFECPMCGQIHNILMSGRIQLKPKRCGCGHKGNFRMLDKKFIKFQVFELVESFDEVPESARKPIRKQVLITENLTRKEINGKLQPGQKVKVTGWIDVEQMKPIQGKPSNEYRTFIIANNIELVERSWNAIKLTKPTKTKCKEMNNSTILQDFAQSIAPTFEGYELLRQSLILQHVEGKRLFDKNGNLDERGVIHILLGSNPGMGKSFLLRRSLVLSPLWNWAIGNGLTSAGLVACISKDEFGSYTLDAGPLVLSDGGILGLDELDKLDKIHFGSLNNAMNDEQTKITKATIDQMLSTKTSILAASNPKHKVFNDDEPVFDQLKPIPKDILDRFDLIWIMDENVDSDKLELKYMARHQEGSELNQPKYSLIEMRNYIAYARRLNPIFNENEVKHFITKYKELTGQTTDSNDSKRIRGNILRLVYAHTKFMGVGVENKNNEVPVTTHSIDFVFELIKASFKSLRIFDESKGTISYTSLENIPSKKQINTYNLVRGVIQSLSKDNNNQVSEEIILHKVRLQIGDFSEDDLYKELERLKNKAEIFEPRRGKWGML